MIKENKKFNKKIWIILIIGIIIIVSIFFFKRTEDSKPDLIIGYSPGSFGHSPIIIGKELGLFEKQGLKVEYIPFSSTKYARQAIAAKQVNIVTGGANNYIEPMSKDIKIKFIAPMVTAPTYIFVRPNEITKLVELNNSLVASRIDATSGYALKRILREDNISINFNFEDIESTYAPIALMDKKMVIAVAKGGEGKEEFLKTGAVVLKEWEEKGYLNRYFLGTSIIIDDSFLENNPEVVDKFIDGYIESQKFIVENPNETYKILAEFMNKDSEGVIIYINETVKNSLSALKFTLWTDPNEFLDFAKYAKEYGIIDKNLSLEDIYNNRFEEKLKKAQIEIYGIKN
ncbi:MAG: ABC transporter substrate-binding protein [archaeon]|nr:ABC transporter substrate-binding protein [archaeon]